MATVTIQIPAGPALETPPTTMFADLAVQARRVTPRTQGSGFVTDPPEALSIREPAVARARVISSHSGTLPDGCEDLLSGAVGTEAERWVKEHYKKIEGEVLNERFGHRSYIQQFLRGRLATFDVKVILTNWTVEVREPVGG